MYNLLANLRPNSHSDHFPLTWGEAAFNIAYAIFLFVVLAENLKSLLPAF